MKSPARVFKFLPVLALLLTLLPCAVSRTEEAKSSTNKTEKKEAAKPANDPAQAIDSMCQMIPEGRRNLKVHYPGFDNGRPSSLITAAAMTRVNPQEMFAEKLRIDLYGKEEKENMRVDLKTGSYHMDTKMLTSNERSHVSRADFKVDGDAMEFDMGSSQGKMIGNVRMVIYDASTFTKKNDTPADPTATSAPAPTAKEPTPPGK